jgi:hypothetical protein
MNEEKKQKQPEPPKLQPPPQQKQMTVTSQPLIQELTESVEQYSGACEETLRGAAGMRRLRGGIAETVFSPPGEDSDIASWNPEKAELMAEKLTEVARCHEGQAERLHEQVEALRRMNTAVIAIRDEVLDDKG